MAKRIVKYNPAFLSKEELVQSFVVRHSELELIVQVLRENVTESNQHVLVIGPRGIGKTMLVLRVVEQIRAEEDLQGHWYPLVFGEESYQVSTPGEFWLETLFHLAHKTGEERWRQTYKELRDERDEERLRERALAQLMDFVDAEGKGILLVVENFNMLLGEQISDSDAWKLRHTLLHEPRVMLLATATSRFEEIDNAEKAMFELFKLYELKPLDDEECEKLWASISRKEASDERVRPLQILTGGNPRLLAIISTFAARMSLKELMDDLMQLVDDNTEYFKSHLDSLPAIERKVYLALAELWDPATARRVADFARLNVNKASSLLRRLIERGMVVEADGERRTKLYQVSERMYNIYYLMRRRGAPSRRVKGLVRFMVPFYGPKELVSLTRRIAEEACKLEPQARKEHFWACEAILESTSVESLREELIEAVPRDFFKMPDMPASLRRFIEVERPKELEGIQVQVQELLEQGEALEERGKLKEAESVYRRAIDIGPQHAGLWVRLGIVLEALHRYAEAEEAYRKITALMPERNFGWALLGCLYQENLRCYEKAEEAYRKAIAVEEGEVFIWVQLGRLLYENFDRYDEAEKALRKAIQIDGEYAPAWAYLGSLLHEKLDRYDEAEKAYQKAIELDREEASTWVKLGSLLHKKLERYEEAEKALREATRLQPKWPVGWIELGALHESLKRYSEAEKAYRKALELGPDMATGWTYFGSFLERNFQRYEEAEKAFRRAIQIDKEYAPPWAQLGQLLHEKLERYEEAEKAYRKAIELQPDMVSGWVKLGGLLHQELERYEEAEKAYRKALALQPKVAEGWLTLGLLLGESLNRDQEAEEAYRKAAELEPENGLAWVLIGRHLQVNVGRREEAEKMYRRAIEVVRGNPPAVLNVVIEVLMEDAGWFREALELSQSYVQQADVVGENMNDVVELFVELAAAGYAKEALEILRGCASAEILEPLVVGLRIYVGEDVKAAAEIMEVGKDVVKRIEERRERIEAERTGEERSAPSQE